MEVMNFFAGRTQQQQHAQSLLDFISIQQSNYLQQITKYNEILRKYNTVCYQLSQPLIFIYRTGIYLNIVFVLISVS